MQFDHLIGQRLRQDVFAQNGDILIPAGRLVNKTLLQKAISIGCDLISATPVPKSSKRTKEEIHLQEIQEAEALVERAEIALANAREKLNQLRSS